MTEATIGILSHDKQQEKATLQCYCPKPSILTIDLLDQLGRPFLHKKFQLQKGDHTVSFDLSKLPGGDYNAWASIGDTMAIRKLVVQPRSSKIGGLLQRWFL